MNTRREVGVGGRTASGARLRCRIPEGLSEDGAASPRVGTSRLRLTAASLDQSASPTLTDETGGVIAVKFPQSPQTGVEMPFSGTGEPAQHSISRERFVTLIVRYERRVRVFVSTLHPKPADVDEILQDAWLVAWKKLDTFRYSGDQPDEEFVRWLCTIARYEVLDYRRKNATRLQLDERVIEELTALQFDKADYFEARHDALMKCIENLRARDKEIIRRRYQEDASVQDVANWIGRSIDAVYKSLNRIRTSLLACVERTLKREGYN
jgi:RNA polymerase sigma-70 factor (ECF subfamily)